MECSGESKYWCNVYYYEFNERYGDAYKSETGRERQELIIDGYCSPSDSTRFCLGAIQNVNRDSMTANVRCSIGKGIRVYCEDNNICLQCIGQITIFVQSPLHASMNTDNLATVYRIQGTASEPGQPFCLFNKEHFEELIEKSKNKGYDAIFSLQVMCFLRISFIKGWGCEYRRQMITETPCWIEAHFPGPLQMLDKLLLSMDDPDDLIDSD